MPVYGNTSGSSITSYEVHDEFLIVRFKNGTSYHYSRSDNGDAVIDHMIELADSGSGLNSYLRKENPSWS